MQAKKQQKQMWNNRLIQNWERSKSRLYIVITLINLYPEYIMQNASLDDQGSNCQHSLDHRESKGIPKTKTKKTTSASLTTQKPLTVWITTNWKIHKEMGIQDHLTCLLRNLYAGKEAKVRKGCGTTD